MNRAALLWPLAAATVGGAFALARFWHVRVNGFFRDETDVTNAP